MEESEKNNASGEEMTNADTNTDTTAVPPKRPDESINGLIVATILLTFLSIIAFIFISPWLGFFGLNPYEGAFGSDGRDYSETDIYDAANLSDMCKWDLPSNLDELSASGMTPEELVNTYPEYYFKEKGKVYDKTVPEGRVAYIEHTPVFMTEGGKSVLYMLISAGAPDSDAVCTIQNLTDPEK